MQECRLDKWLWCVRAFKTRSDATEACRGNSVQVNGLDAKPGRDVHLGETIVVRIGMITKTFKILGLPRARLGAKLVPAYALDLTPPEEYARAKQAGIEHMLARERGRGRPTKKDRRDLGKLFGF
jgi:ribosome-associated heat shock protein Hsp15